MYLRAPTSFTQACLGHRAHLFWSNSSIPLPYPSPPAPPSSLLKLEVAVALPAPRPAHFRSLRPHSSLPAPPRGFLKLKLQEAGPRSKLPQVMHVLLPRFASWTSSSFPVLALPQLLHLTSPCHPRWCLPPQSTGRLSLDPSLASPSLQSYPQLRPTTPPIHSGCSFLVPSNFLDYTM